MARIKPWAMDALNGHPEYDGATLRAVFAGLLNAGDTPVRARPGVISGLEVAIDGDYVYAGAGLVVVSTPDGSFITGLDSETLYELAPRDPTNPRIDRMVARIYHDAQNRDGDIEILTGTPAPNPSPPSLPQDSEHLGTISVPADGGGAAAFTSGARNTTGRGGIIPAPSLTALGQLEPGTDQQPAFATVGGALYASAGDGWGPLSANRSVFFDEDVVNLDSGITLGSQGALGIVERDPVTGTSTVNLQMHVVGLAYPSGGGNTTFGTLMPAVRVGRAGTVHGYVISPNGAFFVSITSAGTLSVRWSNTERTGGDNYITGILAGTP